MANGGLPPSGAYREALLEARSLHGRADAEMLRRIEEALDSYVSNLRRLIGQELGTDPAATQRAFEAAARINRQVATELAAALETGVAEGRGLVFERVLEVWEASALEAAQAVGVSSSALGAVRPPPVTLLNAFESLGAAQNWRTLLRGHVANAAAEANAIVRGAMVEGVGLDELERRMRRYVVGSEQFDELFQKVPTRTGEVAKIDLRRLSPEERQAARQMRFNARRIASSELRNARHEAELQHMIRDPLVEAVQWMLSPDRGSLVPPDECDVIAGSDFYGLGEGVYPVGGVPAPPHPLDRCENFPVTRRVTKMGDPKPDPDRALGREQLELPRSRPRGKPALTSDAEGRILDRADEAVERGKRTLSGILEAA